MLRCVVLAPARFSGSRRKTANATIAAAWPLCCAMWRCGPWVVSIFCSTTIGFISGGRLPLHRRSEQSDNDARNLSVISHHDRRQPAEAVLARGAEQAVGA